MHLLVGRDQARLLANVPGHLLVVDSVAEDHALLVHDRQVLLQNGANIVALEAASGTFYS